MDSNFKAPQVKIEGSKKRVKIYSQQALALITPDQVEAATCGIWTPEANKVVKHWQWYLQAESLE